MNQTTRPRRLMAPLTNGWASIFPPNVDEVRIVPELRRDRASLARGDYQVVRRSGGEVFHAHKCGIRSGGRLNHRQIPEKAERLLRTRVAGSGEADIGSAVGEVPGQRSCQTNRRFVVLFADFPL